MIIITGAAGFIGGNLISYLNQKGITNLILVDDFSKREKDANWKGKKYLDTISRNEFFGWLVRNGQNVDRFIHLGARADTTETDWKVLDELNLEYSKTIFSFCYQLNIPLIYASSAATYGNGELGYSDNLLPEQLKPLNLYAESKNQFDDWVLGQVIDEETPPMWQGLKFFNVYGAGESHKGRMASMVWHAYEQIRTSGKVRLFRSHHPDFADGEQSRDFVHVSDVCAVIHHFCTQYQAPSGLFNLGTGKSRTFLSLVQAVFKNMGVPEQIEWVDTPADIRDKYQYFTEADIAKLRKAGYKTPFLSLEAGVETYIKQLVSTTPQP